MTKSAESGDRTSWSPLMTDVALLSIVGVFFYGLAFIHEAGYFAAFGIPYSLVQTSLDTVFAIAAAVSTGIFVLFAMGNLVALAWPKYAVMRMKLVRCLVLLLIVAWPGLVHGFRVADRIPLLFMLAVLLLFEFMLPLIIHRKKPSIIARFEAYEASEDDTRAKALLGRIQAVTSPVAYTLIIGSLLALYLAHSAGTAAAARSKEFYFLVEDPTSLVVRVYPDSVITVGFDPNTNTVKSAFLVRSIGEHGVALERKHVGVVRFPNTRSVTRGKGPNKPMQPTGSAGG